MRHITLHGLAVVLGLWIGVALVPPAFGACYNAATFCKYLKDSRGRPTAQADTSCPKVPTSLYIVNTNSTTTADDGWAPGTGLCGTDVNTHRPCGDYPLTNGVCGPGGGVATGDPFGEDPCDPSGPRYDPSQCSGGGPFDNLTQSSSSSTPPSSPKDLAVARHLRRIAQQSLPPHVEKAVEALGRISSLHLRASITLSSEQTGDRPVPGVYEYWEKDGKYRIHFGIDLAEIPVSDVAYDGRQYQMALAHSSTLTLSGADERAVPSEIPNPMFLFLQPLSFTTSDCPDCDDRLSDLRTLRNLRQARTVGQSSLAPSDAAGVSAKVTLSASGNPATAVLSKQAGVVERTDFLEYRPIEGTGLDLPRLFKFIRTMQGSNLRVAIRYRIDGLDVDRDIDDSVFTLDRSVFQSIWSDNEKRFLKAPPCPLRRPASQ